MGLGAGYAPKHRPGQGSARRCAAAQRAGHGAVWGGILEPLGTGVDIDRADPSRTQAADTPFDDEPTELRLAAGETLGRYVIGESIGVGGMGRVYRAHDPDLDRDVALKLVRHHGPTLDLDRMRREAMAMAQLSHPNVLPVYDVDQWQGRPFLVMELVDGRTLRQWAKDEERPWNAIVPLFLAAGRGLAAAHDAGLVHRDFKPANVLLGEDGRVRVMDFGLARPHGEQDLPSDVSYPVMRGHDLTAADTVVGTPAYMAPEQLCAEPVGPAADQYAFCVSLWEVSLGQRPFSALDGIDGSRDALAERTRTPPEPANAPWPPAAWAVIRRGLSPRIEDRFESMQQLLTALEHTVDPPSRRRRWLVGGGVATACVGMALAATSIFEHTVPCPSPEQLRVGLWDSAERARTREALLTTDAPHAAVTWEHLAPVLDDYAHRWSESRHAACLAIGDDEGASIDARIRCLDGRRRALAAFRGSMQQADASVLNQAIDHATELPDLATCEDEERLTRLAPPPPPSIAAAVASAYEQLAELQADQDAEHYAQTVAPARALLVEAQALAHAPLTIDVQIALGTALGDESSTEATSVLEQAYFDAIDHGFERHATQAATMLAQVLGVGLGKHDEALRWIEHARVAAERLDDPRLAARTIMITANIHHAAANYPASLQHRQRMLEAMQSLEDADSLAMARARTAIANPLLELNRHNEALEHLEHARGVFERRLGPRHPDLSTVLLRMGSIYIDREELSRAAAYLEQARDIREAAFGPNDITMVSLLTSIGRVEYMRHDFDAARPRFERALAIIREHRGEQHYSTTGLMLNLAALDRQTGHHALGLERLERARLIVEEHFGSENLQIWYILNNSANLHEDVGQLSEAAALHVEALELGRTLHGPESDEVASSLANLGNVQSKRGLHEEAERRLEEARTTYERVLGPDSPEVYDALEFLAYARRRHGDHAQALPLLERVVARRKTRLGAEHPDVLFPQGIQGITLIDLGRLDEGLASLELAHAGLRTRDDCDPDSVAELAFGLARGLWSRPDQRPRALRLARAALRDLSEGATDVRRDDVERWLDEHSR